MGVSRFSIITLQEAVRLPWVTAIHPEHLLMLLPATAFTMNDRYLRFSVIVMSVSNQTA